MPSLFIYAVAFLAILTIVGLVMCCTEGRRAGSRAQPVAHASPAAAPLQRQEAPVKREALPGAPVPILRSAQAPSSKPPGPTTPLAPARRDVRADHDLRADEGDALLRHLSLLIGHVADLKADQHALEAEVRTLRAMVSEGAAGASAHAPIGTGVLAARHAAPASAANVDSGPLRRAG